MFKGDIHNENLLLIYVRSHETNVPDIVIDSSSNLDNWGYHPH